MSTHPSVTPVRPLPRRPILIDRDADGRRYAAPYRQRLRVLIPR